MNWPFHRPTIFRPETRFSKAPQTFCFSKAPKPFRTRKAIFSSSVSKNGVYTAETSCMQGISVHIKNLWMNSSVIVRFEILLWLYGPEKFPGLSRDGPWPDGFRPLQEPIRLQDLNSVRLRARFSSLIASLPRRDCTFNILIRRIFCFENKGGIYYNAWIC